MWVLFSSTELMRRVRVTFDRKWMGGWYQKAALMVMKAWEPFHFHGSNGNDTVVIDADGSPKRSCLGRIKHMVRP